MANDDLGKRMKEQYEVRTRTYLPRRTYTIIRLDGKAFHTLTRGMRRMIRQDSYAQKYKVVRCLTHNLMRFLYYSQILRQ
jgi:tRNA(His) 5'-end guanylyltransferase